VPPRCLGDRRRVVGAVEHADLAEPREAVGELGLDEGDAVRFPDHEDLPAVTVQRLVGHVVDEPVRQHQAVDVAQHLLGVLYHRGRVALQAQPYVGRGVVEDAADVLAAHGDRVVRRQHRERPL